MPPRRTSRIYARTRAGTTRYYGDFRDFAELGGGQEPLIADGERYATTDYDVVTKLAAIRLSELEAQRRGKALLGVQREDTLHNFASEHLTKKARGIRTGKITEGWVGVTEKRLETAIAFFAALGIEDVASITVQHVRAYAEYLEELPSGRKGGTIRGGTQRHYLNALSNLFRRAQTDGLVPLGYNPVAALSDEERPQADTEEARWLEVHEATLLLESARTYVPKRADMANPALHPLLATFLLTGGREAEIYGLDLDDVSFDRKIIHIRPNRWRRLKTKTSRRVVPLWPQLEEILTPFVFNVDAPREGLLFPSVRTGERITDIRKFLDAIGRRVGYENGEIRTKMFRHTYCATRLQTLDRGAAVSEYTVAREMGHGGFDLVRRVYGHLGSIRHRSEVVEYRPEQHLDTCGEMIADLRAGAIA